MRGLAELGPKVNDKGHRIPTRLDIFTNGYAGGLKPHDSTFPTPPSWVFCVIAFDAQGQWLVGFQAGDIPDMAQSLPRELLSAYAEFEAATWAAEWPLASPCDNMDVFRVAQLGGAKGVMQKYEWAHVPGHSSHPWNELVDTAARIASYGAYDYTPCTLWRTSLELPRHMQAIPWAWLS
eukprot:5943748-Pyramimonas_sp.AAC.1